MLSRSPPAPPSAFPSFPRVPLFLLLSHVVRSWVLQMDFVDESENGGAATTRQSGLCLPLRLPLSFVDDLSPSAVPDCPPSWSRPLQCATVASQPDAHEIGGR